MFDFLDFAELDELRKFVDRAYGDGRVEFPVPNCVTDVRSDGGRGVTVQLRWSPHWYSLTELYEGLGLDSVVHDYADTDALPSVSVRRGGVRWPLQVEPLSQKETENMSTRDELLAVIAAAQSKLAGLELLPEDEPTPTGDGEVLTFRAVVRLASDRKDYTYLLLRTPTGKWYRTGGQAASSSSGPTHWHVVRSFLTRYAVVSWDELAPVDRDAVAEAAKIADDYARVMDLLARHGFEHGTAVNRVGVLLDQYAQAVDGKSR